MQKNKQINAKKKYGQNFLNDNKIIDKIIEIIDPQDKKIIEIGPGMGALTQHLVKQANELVTFEIDVDMISFLTTKNIVKDDQIVKGDFLQANLEKFNNFEVVGNIPYYITSEIIFKIIENRHLFNRAVLMVQDEVAERIVAKINTPQYSKLSVTLQYIADVKKELFVDKQLFTPVPKVDSSIISIKFKQNIDSDFNDLMNFFKLCFYSRRKKLSWSLKTKYSIDKINAVYKILGLKELTRIQELSVEEIVKLYRELEK
ncbi:16S rRNA (adenine(1518)-N(6)/adenine(1519)-N(6))-dimethyltransferase RsmA [Mycoplasma sp. CSL7475-4]|uniref:16S rRNA (adenine(1518)-N(6)/adenine(1519)-N(6))- dimethyltransferase RsmA n=1 Tax=Mycoplasma sp. CSL7475-4 TaxID=2973942 RepID=UPI00216B48ED|nr:16S rRNA (adenine(1518)-N(6)/adenine(1519)-N(6))-dimethyltransferase RsmA [Mycoplasma sp. CSL7475-4]MCS4536944.1 16S rRNA (adenine(1518)-N(6)/adenine(1519)-N(6))-dimethyltransferase RsmA [Mycoplasma sp. CSL7475-4]